ncbi:TPA: hypothetical protein ACWV5T_002402 [Salmonella enterica subsp. enterica serovar Muenchen]
MKRLTDKRIAALIDMVPLNETIADIKSGMLELQEYRKAARYRDLSQPVDPQVAEYEKIMLQAGNSPVIPDGYVLVPVEPTPEMREAFHVANKECESGHYGIYSPDHQWQAMLVAAPEPEEAND